MGLRVLLISMSFLNKKSTRPLFSVVVLNGIRLRKLRLIFGNVWLHLKWKVIEVVSQASSESKGTGGAFRGG